MTKKLNEQVAEALGWERRSQGYWWCDPPIYGETPHTVNPLPKFSTDIEAAWFVVERLRADGWLVTVKHMPDGFPFIVEGSRSEYDHPHPDTPLAKSAGKAVCELMHMNHEEGRWRHNQWAIADTVPLAVCQALIKAVTDSGRGGAR